MPQTTAAGQDLGVRFREVDLRVITHSKETLWGLTWDRPADWVGAKWTWDDLDTGGSALEQASRDADLSIRKNGSPESMTFTGDEIGTEQPDWADWRADDGSGTGPEDWAPLSYGGGVATVIVRPPDLVVADLVPADRAQQATWEWTSSLRANGEVVAQCGGQSGETK